MSIESLTLFDRINIAKCASDRACAQLFNAERFNAEYSTARLWIKYKCNITPGFNSFVEPD